VSEQYSRHAADWSTRAYADSETYLRRRAELVAELGTPLAPGDLVCDLACGDGGLGEFLLARGLAYVGVDENAEMVAAARSRLAGRARVEQTDLNDYAPADAVAATTLFRALYYVRDRDTFFRHVASYTKTKIVFDVSPRRYDVGALKTELAGAGFPRAELRPFFVPQRVALPRPVAAAARAAEGAGPLARLVLRARFTYVVSASRS
jgi:SAM-dependent methyltransferase